MHARCSSMWAGTARTIGAYLNCSKFKVGPGRKILVFAALILTTLLHNQPLVVRANLNRFAGAISSITWNGAEFVDSYDHGRELQSDLVYETPNECNNPTEAGSQDDGTGYTTSSKLLSYKQEDTHSFSTEVQMANWVLRGESAPSCSCPIPRSQPSDTILTKHVTLGALGQPNLLRFDLTYSIPDPHLYIGFEVLTQYMSTAFNTAYTYDGSALSPVSTTGKYSHPIIVATADGKYASGVYVIGAHFYGAHLFSQAQVQKWSAGSVLSGCIPPSDHSFTAYSAVGTLKDVKTALQAAIMAANGGQ